MRLGRTQPIRYRLSRCVAAPMPRALDALDWTRHPDLVITRASRRVVAARWNGLGVRLASRNRRTGLQYLKGHRPMNALIWGVSVFNPNEFILGCRIDHRCVLGVRVWVATRPRT